MTSDLEAVPGVAGAARRRLENGELVFAVKDVLRVIHSCNSSQTAILGVEIFSGLNASTYDLGMESPPGVEFWSEFVKRNNTLAEEFVQKQIHNKAESDCILTTASWREFCEIANARPE
jgi:hypothetical protein